MKRYIIPAIIPVLIALFVFSGCGKINTENLTEPDNTVTETEPVEETEPEHSPEEFKGAYNGILDAYYEYMVMGVVPDLISDDYFGVGELMTDKKPDQILSEIGYTVKDITSDGIPELIIGFIPGQEESSKDIRALYTLDGSKPKLVFYGASRNLYSPLGGGRFMNSGSGGAAYAVFGTYALSADGKDLVCEDFWFTHEKDGDFSDIRCYHNTSGEWDVSVSEETEMTSEEFSEKEKSIAGKTVGIELVPFSEYLPSDYAGQAVEVSWKDEAGEIGEYDTADVDSSENAVEIVFTCARPVKDFKVLALTLKDVDENGNADFDVEEKYSADELNPGRPLVVTTVFYGDIPNNGISFTDNDGNTKRYTVSVSGMDGSLILAEF